MCPGAGKVFFLILFLILYENHSGSLASHYDSIISFLKGYDLVKEAPDTSGRLNT